jgi:hypothetical protein
VEDKSSGEDGRRGGSGGREESDRRGVDEQGRRRCLPGAELRRISEIRLQPWRVGGLLRATHFQVKCCALTLIILKFGTSVMTPFISVLCNIECE